MRTFVAVPLSEDIRRKVVEAQKRLVKSGAHVSWTKPDNIHITVKFLGELGEEHVSQYGRLLKQIGARYKPFALDMVGIGTFPPRGAPRVIWVGSAADVPVLSALARDVEQAATEVGVPKEGRPFTAHATLGRVKSSKGAVELRKALEREEKTVFGTMTVDRLIFFQSRLTPAGSIYTELAQILLSDV